MPLRQLLALILAVGLLTSCDTSTDSGLYPGVGGRWMVTGDYRYGQSDCAFFRFWDVELTVTQAEAALSGTFGNGMKLYQTRLCPRGGTGLPRPFGTGALRAGTIAPAGAVVFDWVFVEGIT